MRRLALLAALALAFAVPASGASPAGPATDDDDGVLPALDALTGHGHQHGENDGHLPAVQRNVELLGTLDLFADGAEQPGRISDVAAFGDHAYLGAFREPRCGADTGGVHVVDIEDPKQPQLAGFIPASPYTYVGEGVQVLDMHTSGFEGQVLIHSNEVCSPVPGAVPAGRGGASLWDVTTPEDPQPLAEHVGDEDLENAPTSVPHESHSAFGWQQGDAAYMALVDNAELGNVADPGTDIDIFDITDPTNPRLVVETGLPHFPEVLEDPAPNGNNAFVHDMVVKKVANRFLLLASYWDGGYVVLDVTGLPARPTLVGDTDFGPTEPFADQLGLPADFRPEGNAHQAEFNRNGTLFLGADEDFNPYRVTGKVESGRYTGATFSASQGSDVPQVDEKTTLTGPTTFVGQACGAVPPAASADHVAVIERGTCTFTVKVQSVQAAGYAAGIVFNDRQGGSGCDAQVNMLAVGDIPFLFAGRTAGLQLLGVEFDDPCETGAPEPGRAGAPVSITAVFDGWGYLHLYDAGTMGALDHWALPESLDPAHASGFGDLSIHEVAMHPHEDLAFVSHYAGGFRVLEFDRRTGITEVGAYVAEGGSNVWGVEAHALDSGEVVALASDRDSGLWIFRYTPDTTGTEGGATPAGSARKPAR